MAGYGKEADSLLGRLGELGWKDPKADPDAVDAGLGSLWPGPAVVVAVPRPPLS